MSMCKKILCILIVLCLNLSPAMAAQSQGGAEIQKDYGFMLRKLDLMDFEYANMQGSQICRDEFAKMLTKFMGLSDIDAAPQKSYYYDVGLDNPYIAHINRLTDMGIISGYEKMFYPGKTVSLEDAAACITNVLGYAAVKKNSAYNKSDVAIAADAGVLDGVNPENSSAVTVKNIMMMFANTLDAKMVITGSSNAGGFSVKTGSDETFLSHYRKIYSVTGLIDGNYLTSFYKGKTPGENRISIDSDIYALTEENAYLYNYLGYRVKAYYRQNDDGDKEIVYAQNRLTEKLVISSNMYDSYVDGCVRYTKPGTDKKQKARIAPGAVVLYNGLVTEQYDDKIFDIENGSIELLSTGGEYEVVKIYSYTEFAANTVSVKDGIIYGKNGEICDVSKYRHSLVYNRLGREIPLSEIAPRSIVSVGEGCGGSEFVIVIVSDEKISGTLNGISESDSAAVWTVDDSDYEISSGYIGKNIEVGYKGDFYLNYRGEIAYAEATVSENLKYGFLIDIKTVGLEDKLYIFTADGKAESFTVGGRVSIDGDSCAQSEISGRLQYDEKGTATGQVYPQMIKYNAAEDGTVKEIFTVNGSPSRLGKNALTLDYSGLESIYYQPSKRIMSRPETNTYVTNITVGDDPMIFVVPNTVESAKNDIDTYKVLRGSAFWHERVFSNISAYNVDYEHGGTTNVFMQKVQTGIAGPGEYPLANSVLVTGKGRGVDENGFEVNVLYGYDMYSGEKRSVAEEAGSNAFSSADTGDMVRYGANDQGKITGCRIDMDSSSISYGVLKPFESVIGHYMYYYSQHLFTCGIITDIDANYMYVATYISYGEDGRLKRGNALFDIGTAATHVYIFSQAEQKIRKADTKTLCNYIGTNKVVVYSSYLSPKTVVVYTN